MNYGQLVPEFRRAYRKRGGESLVESASNIIANLLSRSKQDLEYAPIKPIVKDSIFEVMDPIWDSKLWRVLE